MALSERLYFTRFDSSDSLSSCMKVIGARLLFPLWCSTSAHRISKAGHYHLK